MTAKTNNSSPQSYRFFSSDEIRRAVLANQIEIKPFAIFDEGHKAIEAVGKSELLKTSFFEHSIELDSFRFHLGPYVLLEASRGRSGSALFKRNEEWIWDLRVGPLLLFPGEFVVIGTNENLRVAPQIGGEIYPLVRNTDVGLSSLSGCIDPSWEGILQIGLTNHSRSPKELHYLDPICILRFYWQAAPSTELKKRFHAERPHSGNTWEKIFAHKGTPVFPRRDPTRAEVAYQSEEVRNAKRNAFWKRILRGVAGLGALTIITTLSGLLYYVITLKKEVEGAIENKTALVRLEERVNGILSAKDKLHLIQTHAFDLAFSRIAPRQTLSVSLDLRSDKKPFSAISFDGIDEKLIKVTTTYVSSEQDIESITFEMAYVGQVPIRGAFGRATVLIVHHEFGDR